MLYGLHANTQRQDILDNLKRPSLAIKVCLRMYFASARNNEEKKEGRASQLLTS